MMIRDHVDRYNAVQVWIDEKTKYLKTKEHINSISEANKQLSLLETYEKNKARLTSTRYV